MYVQGIFLLVYFGTKVLLVKDAVDGTVACPCLKFSINGKKEKENQVLQVSSGSSNSIDNFCFAFMKHIMYFQK